MELLNFASWGHRQFSSSDFRGTRMVVFWRYNGRSCLKWLILSLDQRAKRMTIYTCNKEKYSFKFHIVYQILNQTLNFKL